MDKKIDEYFLKYFILLNWFLKKDAAVSLLKGRDRNLILLFYKTFIALNKCSTTKIYDDFVTEFENLKKHCFSYMKENSDISNINLECHYLDNSKELNIHINKILTEYLKNFIVANELYFKLRNNLTDKELKKIYIKNVSEYYFRFFSVDNHSDYMQTIINNLKNVSTLNNPMLKQALMEFFNAISHLLKVVCRKDKDSNQESFNIHLYRGTLDYYKAIIKDISFLYTFDDNELIELNSIREFEYTRIGNSVDRIRIVNKFKTLVVKLLAKHNKI